MQLEMWQSMRNTAEKRFAEALVEHKGERGTRDIAQDVANEVAKDYLYDAKSYTAFLADDCEMLWRAMDDKANCENIQDVLFAFAEGDLREYLLDYCVPTPDEDEEDAE